MHQQHLLWQQHLVWQQQQQQQSCYSNSSNSNNSSGSSNSSSSSSICYGSSSSSICYGRAKRGRTRLVSGLMLTPAATAAFSNGSNWRGGGTGCRLSSAWAGKCFRIWSATVMLASSIISSTMWFASLTWYMPTSKGSCVSVSISNLTSGDARVKAPLWASNGSNNDYHDIIKMQESKYAYEQVMITITLTITIVIVLVMLTVMVLIVLMITVTHPSKCSVCLAQDLPCQVSKPQWWNLLNDLSQQTKSISSKTSPLCSSFWNVQRYSMPWISLYHDNKSGIKEDALKVE